MSDRDNIVLSVRGLRMGFVADASATPLVAVDGVDLEVRAGETLALLGESGCGKSAAALSVLRLLPAAGRILDGNVVFEGREVLALPENEMRGLRCAGMAMIFQEPATSLNPVMTVAQQICEVLEQHRQMPRAQARERALELLNAVGIADAQRRLDEYPFQLSGGMKQRVMIAIALAGDPRVLIADEPTTALDVTVQAQILELLQRLQAERGMGMLLITHDLGVVAHVAHRVAVMYAGEIVEEAPREVFFAAPRHPYTRKLFAALPDSARRGEWLQTIAGQVPALAEMPPGCRFAGRCPLALAQCRLESPGWTDLGAGHRARCHRVHDETPAITDPLSRAVRAEGPASGESDGALLEVRDLQVHFPIRSGVLRRVVGHVRAVDGVTLELERGRTLALVGESGCGKTTVGKAVLQLIAASSGSVRLDGCELTALSRRQMRPLRRRVQMIFQDPFASLNPRLSVGEIIAEGMAALGGPQEAGAQRAAIIALLRQVGLDAGAMGRYPHEFSGGQRQRIAIARALAVQPELLVCDEPTSALDVSVQAQILNLLKGLQNDLGLAYLFITHNFAAVEYMAHEVAVMYLGRVVERGLVDEVLRSPRHPYTQALLAAVPKLSSGARAEPPRLPGEMPSPAKPPSGCRFHTRCPVRGELCLTRDPETVNLSSTHQVSCHLIR